MAHVSCWRRSKGAQVLPRRRNEISSQLSSIPFAAAGLFHAGFFPSVRPICCNDLLTTNCATQPTTISGSQDLCGWKLPCLALPCLACPGWFTSFWPPPLVCTACFRFRCRQHLLGPHLAADNFQVGKLAAVRPSCNDFDSAFPLNCSPLSGALVLWL